jgi:hypothetical protein
MDRQNQVRLRADAVVGGRSESENIALSPGRICLRSVNPSIQVRSGQDVKPRVGGKVQLTSIVADNNTTYCPASYITEALETSICD